MKFACTKPQFTEIFDIQKRLNKILGCNFLEQPVAKKIKLIAVALDAAVAFGMLIQHYKPADMAGIHEKFWSNFDQITKGNEF